MAEAIDKRIARTRVRAGTLASALRDVAGVVQGRNTVPVLENVLIEVADGAIALSATDLDIWVRRTLASDDAGEGDSAVWKASSAGFAMTVPAKVLAAVLGEIDPDAMAVLLAPTDAEARAVVQAGRARFKLPVLPVDDFPVLPEPLESAGEAARFEIRASQLADSFAGVEHAVSTEETRYYLNGVFLHPVDLTLRFAATDGHRLARVAIDGPMGSASWPDMIVPRRAVAILDKLLASAIKADDAATVDVTGTAGRVQFALPAADAGEVALTTKLIDGSFPDYTRVIPTAPPCRAVVDREGLNAAVKRVATMAAKQSRAVKLEFAARVLTLSASAPELGEAVEELPCDFTGTDALSIGFDSRYLRDALGAVASDSVVLRLTDAGSPCRIEAEGADADGGEALVQVVMPVRV